MVPAVMWQSNPPEKLLKEHFHISTGFHPGQRDIIEQLIQGKRLLVIQRTGWGKSLCYQMASLYYPHLTLVFSPLKALMRDQCQRCNDVYNIPATIVSSEFSQEENKTSLAQAVDGNFKVLFIAPERLDNAEWQSSVQQMRISMIVIDEAHCVSTWGHDFRPHYQRIVKLLSALPKDIPVLALTATANQRVEDDVLQQIGSGAHVIRGTMQRPNLYLNVEYLHGDKEKLAFLAELLPRFSGTGIIYTATKHDAEMVAAFLQQQGIQAEYYHAGREEGVRQDVEQKLMANHYRVVCSTNALGMGIDKPDIRFIIHYQIPGSPIHEAGWSLSYHGTTRTGKLVRASKYEDAGPFAKSLVSRAVDVIRNRYPLEAIDGIVSVPPTRSGILVETFARQVADLLGLEYLPILSKVRQTREQKSLSNWLQKADNVKDAFIVHFPEQVAGRTLLLIDDIYDSGYMLREVGLTLMQAGAQAVYPLTITRTAHSDDQ